MGDYPDHTTLTQIVGTEITIPISIDAATITLDVDIVAQSAGDLNVNLAASDITLNVDIVAQTVGNIAVNVAAAVTLDVDITAQTLSQLNVNLAASDITLNINIAASDITLNVDITAQTIGNLTIDIETQSVGVYQQPEWACLQGLDKNIYGYYTDKAAAGDWTCIDYTVTTGKTLYICAFGFACLSQVANVYGYIYNVTTSTALAITGGAQGSGQVFNKVIKVTSGQNIVVKVAHFGAANGDAAASLLGYEI